MSFRSLLLLFVSIPVALGASACTSEATSAPPSEPTGAVQSRATFSFGADKVESTRMPFHAGCGEANAAFTDDDLFNLQPVTFSRTPSTKLTSIAISFRRTVQKDVPLDLVIGGPVNGGTVEGAEHAHGSDEKSGLGIVAFRPEGSASKPLSKATVTLLDIPTKDGEASSAHLVLEFEDGDILDETFTGALKSYEGACGGGG